MNLLESPWEKVIFATLLVESASDIFVPSVESESDIFETLSKSERDIFVLSVESESDIFETSYKLSKIRLRFHSKLGHVAWVLEGTRDIS